MEECVFCLIAARKLDAHVVYEDSEFLVFLDKYPVTLGHSLVVPKQHYESIFEMPDELVGRAFALAKRVALAQLRGLGASGVRLVMNNGRGAGQEIMHAHVHVVPYGVPRRGRATLDPREGEEVARRIREALG